MAKVLFKNVTKTFGETIAVDHIDLEVADKQFVVLVGPSGCGKTTALRLLAGLEETTSGEIYIGDRLVNEVSPKDRNVAMVFQNYALYPHMNVYKNLAIGLKLRKFDAQEIDRRVREAATILELTKLLDRKPAALSGGERQRVAMGRAIVRKPDVFLFDEPLSNLDAKLRIRMRAEIKQLHARLETTIIYVTHDQVEAMTLADQIVVMNRGIIMQHGSPLEVYRHPRSLFVAGFIGAPSMNFLRVKVSKDDARLRFNADGIDVSLPAGEFGSIGQSINGEMIIGVRPEHLSIAADGQAALNQGLIEGIVQVTEPMGSQTLVHLEVGKQQVVAICDSEKSPPCGHRCGLMADGRKLHLFDPKTEQALL
jgi:multiple sugar transport system ATP-binding protein